MIQVSVNGPDNAILNTIVPRLWNQKQAITRVEIDGMVWVGDQTQILVLPGG
jgi:hypothetical protein